MRCVGPMLMSKSVLKSLDATGAVDGEDGGITLATV